MLRLLFFIASLVLGIFILRSAQFHNVITNLGNFELLSAFIAGIFFVISFTVVPSAAVLLTLSETMNPLALSLLAGLGGMCGDYLLMRFFRSETDELIAKAQAKHYKNITNILKSRFFTWLGPFIGMAIIASPFPDEIGIMLLGITKLETKKFLLLVFLLDTVGIFVILTIGGIFK